MFRQRNSQKPADALLANFRQQFPEVASTGAEDSPKTVTAPMVSVGDTMMHAPLPDHGHPHHIGDTNAFQDHDPTPRASNEPWRFTPSLMDPAAFSFNNFNPSQGYYTPTPGGAKTLFYHQSGALHSPAALAASGLGSPMSMPTSATAMNTGPPVMDMGGFQTLPTHQMHHFSPFVQAPPPQTAFDPTAFVHQDAAYETMEQDASPLTSNPDEHVTSIDSTLQNTTPMLAFQPGQHPTAQMNQSLIPLAGKFRFHSTLNAPTAMVRHTDEIPVTYLNKGQAYSLSIIDSHAMMPVTPGTKFRTFVRVSFEDEEQRQKPGVCWGLWKEGRGANEAHQRGGKLQAVEYVEAGQPPEGDEKRTRVELESASFDGFSVIWTPGSQGAPEVNIAVRFNFLSTDFSHSKGVKGIPVRLCAKTRPVAPDQSSNATDTDPEICYCKVKLFRDHGAERKLSNDVAHVKKSIDKVKHQIAQAESGLKDVGKRKRASGVTKMVDAHRAGKGPKTKRTWSVSSASSVDGAGGARGGGASGRTSLADDLHAKLQTLQDMFTSTRPVSVLYLRGEEHDDPDAHPVSLPGDSQGSSSLTSREEPAWQARSVHSSNTGSMVSPSPSSQSHASQASAAVNHDAAAASSETVHMAPEKPTNVQKLDEGGKLSGWIQALGVDKNYRPPSDQCPKPVACFYVLYQGGNDGPGKRDYHHAVYLFQRSLENLRHQVAKKFGLDASTIRHAIHVKQDGLEIAVDDDWVQNIREGQDMVLEIQGTENVVKREWEMAVDGVGLNGGPLAGGSGGTRPLEEEGLVLRLIF